MTTETLLKLCDACATFALCVIGAGVVCSLVAWWQLWKDTKKRT